MDSVLKRYILVTSIVIVSICLIEILCSEDWLDWIIIGVGMCALYPCLVSGMYMYLEGRGAGSINGIDLSGFTESELKNYSSFFGFYMSLGTVVLMIGLGLLLNSMVLGIVLMLCAIVLMLVPAIAMKERGRHKKFKERDGTQKAMIFLVFSVLAIAPMVALENASFNTETVEVEFFDDHFTVKAPMINMSFKYDEVEMLGYDLDFDKGSRISGYGTPTIMSGTFKNNQFGTYKLASYTKVDPCIFFQYGDGKYFAFNQSNNLKTEAVYKNLESFVGNQ